jgi:2-keto-4-pentenoate hydratase/2-oxohepta-3-ene-1,7-dioic acid hydratase in catechol pathway
MDHLHEFWQGIADVIHRRDIWRIPRGSEKTDWEVELGVVVGKEARHMTEEDALSHVAGYCVVNDVSERAFQLEGTGQWVKGKSGHLRADRTVAGD